MDLNKVLLIGNLTRDPELRNTSTGKSVTKFRLAVNQKFGQTEETLFINVDCWGRTAELCAEYLTKGSQVLVEGRLKMDNYTTRDGQERNEISITADRVRFGARARGGEGGGGDYGGGQGDYSSQSRQSSGGEHAPSREPASEPEGTEDDLPF